jgi:hypothetical protein
LRQQVALARLGRRVHKAKLGHPVRKGHTERVATLDLLESPASQESHFGPTSTAWLG